MGRLRTRVYGVGINDADYPISWMVDGKQLRCPFYMAWKNMLQRCYSIEHQKRQPTYIGCSVSAEWLLFSRFKKWMAMQGWKGMALDKDLLVKGNKMYSTGTCVFVPEVVNAFILDSGSSRGEYLIGCYWHKAAGKFRASCRNPFTKKREHLGGFATELEAHEAWKKRKHELACELADSEYVTNDRVADALRARYLGLEGVK